MDDAVEQLIKSEQFSIALKEVVTTAVKEAIDHLLPELIKTAATDAIETTLVSLKKTLTDVNHELNDLKRSCTFLKEENRRLKDDLKSVKAKANENEQYSRRNNIRIFGLTEEGTESPTQLVVKFLKKNLDIDISESEIDKVHRIGKPQDGKPPPLIVKFTTHRSKEAVLSRKRNLKGKRIFVAEDLTKPNFQLLKATKNLSQVTSCWSRNGKIFAKVNNSPRILLVRNTDDLDELLSTDVEADEFQMSHDTPFQG